MPAGALAWRVVDVALCVGASVPPLCMDGLPPWATLVTVVLGAIAATAVIFAARPLPIRAAPPLVWLALAGLAWTALELLPIPAAWLRALTRGSSPPIALEHAQIASGLLGRDVPGWLPITTSPADTRLALVVGGAALAFGVAGSVAVAHGRRRSVVRAAALSTVATAWVVLAHLALRTTDVYGVLPITSGITLVSPLVNENHLAGFLSLGVPLCVCLGISASTRQATIAWMAAAALDATLAIAAISRGGLLGLFVSLVVVAALAVREGARHRRTGPPAGSPHVWIGVLTGVLVAGGLASYALGDRLVSDLESTTLYKVRLAVRGLDLVARSPWVGVGRGGYSSAFVLLEGVDTRYEYPESFPVQWAAEWGAPFALALGVALASLVIRAFRGRLAWERIGALAALVGLAAHELVDFATEMPGVLVVAILVAAAALHGHEGRGNGPSASGRGAWLAAPALALVLACAPGVSTLGTRVSDRRAVIEARIRARDWGGVDRALAVALTERPGEPSYVLLGAHARALRGDPTTIRWLNAVMRLAPHWSSPHLVAAEYVARRGSREQAMLELREVERRDPMRSIFAACRLLRAPADGDSLVRIMSSEPAGNGYLEAVLEICPDADAAAAARIDDVLRNRRVPAARRRAAERALAAGDDASALAELEGLTDADDARVSFVRAEALVHVGRAGDAVELLEATHPAAERRTEWLSRLARAQAAAGDADAMRQTVGRLEGEAAGRSSGVAEALMLEAELDVVLGDLSGAYTAYERASDADPSSPALARGYALAVARDEPHRAESFRSRLCARAPHAPECAVP